MFESIRLPDHIDSCPIAESVLEIRYNSILPSDAIFGIIYSKIMNYFSGAKPESLPILQIPEAVRQNDPNLIYQAHYKLFKKNLGMTIGPRSIVFSCLKPYVGWESWNSFFIPILNDIGDTGVFTQIERLGLRYINIFQGNILDKINLNLVIGSKQVVEESTNIRSELLEDGFIKILQIVNRVAVQIPPKTINGSLIDIDCVKLLNVDFESFISEFPRLIDLAHMYEKQLFFGLLTPSYLSSMNPVYRD
jgi:uncharacterized protein (TIGR04255 family)